MAELRALESAACWSAPSDGTQRGASLNYSSEQARMGATRALLYAPLILLFALIAAASFLPDKRLWGINHLAFHSPALRIVALSLIGL